VPWLVAAALLIGGFLVFRRTSVLVEAAWQRAGAEAMLDRSGAAR